MGTDESAVALIDPKFPHNVGNAYRSCAAFGIPRMFILGERWMPDGRLPRELRLNEYQEHTRLVSVSPVASSGSYSGYLKHLATDRVPVAVEVNPRAEQLTSFRHPENALYIFGPEDGTLGKEYLELCHRVVTIPSDFCLNLASAVSCVLMHRRMVLRGL